jgi:hypothetical protein
VIYQSPIWTSHTNKYHTLNFIDRKYWSVWSIAVLLKKLEMQNSQVSPLASPPPPLDYKSNNYVSSKILGIRLVFTRGRPRLLSSPPFYNNQAGSPWYKIVPVFLTSFNPVWIPAPRRNLIYSRANYLFSQVRKTFAESKYSWAGLSWLIRRLIIID